MQDLHFLAPEAPRNAIGEALLRAGVGLVFVVFGLEKFGVGQGVNWVQVFRQIGWGEWFRYFTGVVEVAGGVLLCLPRTGLIGALMLAGTMAGAMAILAFVLRRPADAIFPGVLLAGLLILGWRLRGDGPTARRRC